MSSKLASLFVLAFLCSVAAAEVPHVSFDYITSWTHNDTRWLARYGMFGLGTGPSYEPHCARAVNRTLNATPQYVQITMSMATTLITLLPTLLTIGNLYVASSSEIFSTSTLVGISSSALSFGLPVKSISGIHARQKLDVASLAKKDLRRLREFGQTLFAAEGKSSWIKSLLVLLGWRQVHNAYGEDCAKNTITMDELHEWTTDNEDRDQFYNLRRRIFDFRIRRKLYGIPRALWWIVPWAMFFSQVGLILAISLPVLWYVYIGWPIYDCTTVGQVWWVLASTVTSAMLKYATWTLSDHELVRIHMYSAEALKKAGSFAKARDVTASIPPTRPWHWNPFKIVANLFRRLIARLQYLWEHLGSFRSLSPARRKAFTVLIHLTPSARSPFPIILSGFLEGIILLTLTFFFGTFWAGGLVGTMIYVVTTMIAVTIGRMLGIAYVKWSEDANGFSIIECTEKDEVRGVLRILASLPDELVVEVNQAWYFHGARIDQHPEFKRWLADVERGSYDRGFRLRRSIRIGQKRESLASMLADSPANALQLDDWASEERSHSTAATEEQVSMLSPPQPQEVETKDPTSSSTGPSDASGLGIASGRRGYHRVNTTDNLHPDVHQPPPHEDAP